MSQRIALPSRAAASPRRPAPSSDAAASALALLGALGRAVGRRPGLVFASVALVGGMGVFGWNALHKQLGRHPAPLFAGARSAAPAGEPPRRPEVQGTSYTKAEPAAAATTRSVVPAPPPRAQSPDAIASLIRSGGEAAKPAKAPVDAKADAARVLTVQKALLKAGYGPIGTDGVAGAVTRQALERFERDRNLPVTGSLAPRTLKQLASVSGMRIE